MTPLRPRPFAAADLTVSFLIGMAGIVLALLVGMVGFGVRPQGNLLLVLATAALGLIAFLALGYALAAIYPSAPAATGIGNGLMILLMLTSGAFVPLAVLPVGVQCVISFSPIRHLVDLMQGLWNGHPWSDYTLSTAVLAGMVVVFGALGARLFKWQ